MSLWLTTSHICCHNLLLEELSLSCEISLGEVSWNLATGFLGFLMCLFPLLRSLFAFAVTSNSPGHNYTLSPMSPPSESTKTGVVLVTPNSNGKLFYNQEHKGAVSLQLQLSLFNVFSFSHSFPHIHKQFKFLMPKAEEVT